MKEVKEDRRVRKTRKLYEDALIKLLKTKDINKITVTDLSEKVDMNRGTFYIHYDDIYDLLDSIETNLIKEFEKIAEIPQGEFTNILFEEAFARIVKALEYIDERREIFKVLLNEQGNLQFLAKIKKMFSQKLLYNLFDISCHVDKKYSSILSSFLISGFIGIIQEWLNNNESITVFELATVIQITLRSSVANVGGPHPRSEA